MGSTGASPTGEAGGASAVVVAWRRGLSPFVALALVIGMVVSIGGAGDLGVAWWLLAPGVVINFYPSTLEARVADEFPDDAVTALSDTSQVASYSYGRRFRYNAELGVDGSIARPAGWDGWLLEVDGRPFESVEEFMAIVDQIVITPVD